MRTFAILPVLLVLCPQARTQNGSAIKSGSPVGLTFEAFVKQYSTSARCFFGDDKKPETLEFCFVEPKKDGEILLFGRFVVIKEMVTFADGKISEMTAAVKEKPANVTKYLDAVSPKPDLIKDCVRRADETAKYEAEFHSQGIPDPDKGHYEDELREASLEYHALGCGDISAETMTSWKYQGEEIIVPGTLPAWTPIPKPKPPRQDPELEAVRKQFGLPSPPEQSADISGITAIRIRALPAWLDQGRSPPLPPAGK